MVKRIFAYVFHWPLVWTRDYDGEVRLRLVKLSPWGEHTVLGVFNRNGTLCRDGSIKHCAYMTHWKAANKYAESLFDA